MKAQELLQRRRRAPGGTPTGAGTQQNGAIHSGKALEVLLDLAQMFGSVSLFDAAVRLREIASQLPGVYFGVALLWSFFATSILHTIGAALEVFEGEYQKNWAVLGLNWTANFNGLLLFLVSSASVGESSFPWLSMVTPAIQTVVLVYVLSKLKGGSRRSLMILLALDVFLTIVIAVVVHAYSRVVTLCTDISLLKDHDDPIYVAYIPEDCFDVSQMFNNSIIAALSVDEDEVVAFSRTNCTGEGICSSPIETVDASTTRLFLSNLDTRGYWISGMGIAGVTIAATTVLLLGGSFVRLIIASRSTDRTKLRRALEAVLIIGWVLFYPIYEVSRLGVRLFSWCHCLVISLKEGKYGFDPDGTILLSDQP